MCGIAGFESLGAADGFVADALLGELDHRGPDGHWTASAAGWRLVQNRLAVIDLSPELEYPMRNEDGNLALLFNGEIYNHVELRRELERSGHTFTSRCDAEVVVHGFEEWNTDLFRRLEGMWAIAIADERSGELVLARDPRGIKPLYVTTGSRFGFASEVIALVAAGLSRGERDHDAIDEYLTFHYIPPPLTGVTDVRALPPGTFMRRSANGVELRGTWSRPKFGEGEGPVTAHELDEILGAAVARQLRADVPVGIFLSGGLDSSLLLSYSVAAGVMPRAFTLTFTGHGDYDEWDTASRLAQHYDVPHERVALDVGFSDALHAVSRAYDVPIADPSAIATLKLAEHAREYITVALTGTGGDDLFAGYYRHRAHLVHRYIRGLPVGGVARLDAGRGRERRSRLALARSYLVRLAAGAGEDAWEQYLSVVGASTSDEGLGVMRSEPSALTAIRQRVFRRHSGETSAATLDAIQEFELATYLDGNLMVKEDRATMAFGVEGRVPLLDDHVHRIATSTTPKQRATLTRGKILLRDIARDRLPSGWARQRKRGFAVPMADLLGGPWRTAAVDWLGEHDSELVDTLQLRRLVPQPDRASDVWALIVLCAWDERLGAAKRVGGNRALAF